MEDLTLRQLVSQVRSMNKLISGDNVLTDRTVAQEINSVNVKYVLQKYDNREALTSPSLFTTLPCIPMVKVDIVECCDVQTNCKIRKSEYPLPPIANSKFNNVVQGVWSLDKRVRFKECPPNRYANYLKLNNKTKERFFWIIDNYLYVTDENIEKVAIAAFFTEPVDTRLYSCEGEPLCPANPLDLPFRTLPKIVDDIKVAAYQRVMEIYRRSVRDPQVDNIEQPQ